MRRRGEAEGTDDRVGGELVHPERGAGRRRAGVAELGEVEGALERAALAGAAVAADDDAVDGDRTALPTAFEEAAVGTGDELELLAAARRAVDEVGGLEIAVGAVPRSGLRPVERHDVVTLLRRDARDLQTGEDADVVLGRRPPEAHGDGCGHGPSSGARANDQG